eukprot:482524-Amphidinium_carterae.1
MTGDACQALQLRHWYSSKTFQDPDAAQSKKAEEGQRSARREGNTCKDKRHHLTHSEHIHFGLTSIL